MLFKFPRVRFLHRRILGHMRPKMRSSLSPRLKFREISTLLVVLSLGHFTSGSIAIAQTQSSSSRADLTRADLNERRPSQALDATTQSRSDQDEEVSISRPTLFFSPDADALLRKLSIFPADNPFNVAVDDWPVHPNSEQIVESVGTDKPLRGNRDMSFVLVPPNQPRVAVQVIDYPGESDPGPFPIPDNIPIEGWPDESRKIDTQELRQIQERPTKYEGDRHAIVVDPVNGMLYEFFTFGRTPNGWAAGQASVFDLGSNRLRPDGWTSADAAGLPIFPAVVRYDELEQGMIRHAMRVTVRRSRRAYVFPATHFASRSDDAQLPRMGERFRLRNDFDVSGFSPAAQTILKGLKKYGMLVADNGIEWAISIAPDPRIPNLHEELRRVRGADFEVVVAPRQ